MMLTKVILLLLVISMPVTGKARTSKGEYIIVEVQLTKERDFFQRILFGTAKSITD